MEFQIRVWNIRGMNTSDKQNEVRNLMRNENLKIFIILETQLKNKKLIKNCEKVFVQWDWVHNMDSPKGYRIVVGWNTNEV